MGQYYSVVNTTKKQFLKPHKLGDGAKLLEFGLSSLGTMSCLAILLADGNGRGGGDLDSEDAIIGSWAGDNIVIAGDYADKEKFISVEDMQEFVESRNSQIDSKETLDGTYKVNLYTLAGEIYEDISSKIFTAIIRGDRYIYERIRDMVAEGSFLLEEHLNPELLGEMKLETAEGL